LRVAFDWTLDLLFPRDTAVLRFGEGPETAANQEIARRS
jgi:hypothetical protein